MGDPVPADVEHHAADGEVRRVSDLDGRRLEAGRSGATPRGAPLLQGRGRPEHAGRRRGANVDAIRVDAQAIALVRRAVVIRATPGSCRIDRNPTGDGGFGAGVSAVRPRRGQPDAEDAQSASQAAKAEGEFLGDLCLLPARGAHPERDGRPGRQGRAGRRSQGPRLAAAAARDSSTSRQPAFTRICTPVGLV